ncbi:hypothetical protein IU459_12060 [Nocardia amamiensis]|uniref:Uncharacterized protein n=1 Tax=Nocardia amamiensis TaxID=404578 RepID=A0ABS0CNS0_9NOCA|nr:hypothetical protein [Nocardia amamiensis]MBF6298276.1 hypothetical protein [Nocardia amamiensis]
MIAPHPTSRSMITADARELGWTVAHDDSASTGFMLGAAVITVLWTSDDSIFAATIIGGGDAAPERLGFIAVGDPTLADGVMLAWLRGAGYLHPSVHDLTAPSAVVTELASAMRRRGRA